ncbi:MAG: arginine--tRNA ligase [Treponema sp.]|jgi:arginyl-tRNA synthetase|nr:arginine--tRNA ligase [Treponema sp.]
MDYKIIWRKRIAETLNDLGIVVKEEDVIASAPPAPEMGDIGFPMFTFAKILRKSPVQIAALTAEKIGASAQGPYVNVRLNRAEVTANVLSMEVGASENEKTPILKKNQTLNGKRIMVEFSSPNTNKPLHLGHLRNDILGESISRILSACGAEVRKVCIINDRGVHICKSMLAYQLFAQGKTPETEGVKSDRFVGDLYVKFHQAASESKEKEAEMEAGAQELLRKWEAGDPETVTLWRKINKWAINGIKQTYARTGVSFDQFYFESQTYLLGKDQILKGLEKGIFSKRNDGAVIVDLTAEDLDEKVLLRKDGTSIYITQDIGTAISRHEDWQFNRLVYVVGSEQQYHFKVLFKILEKLGLEWAKDLFHLSYGMVNLPEGKMKSREGTVVDADALLDSLKEMALTEIRDKEREEVVGDKGTIAEKIALGALHYYLLQTSAAKDMLFNPKESLSFNGNTGPYLQYMGARISALLRKSKTQFLPALVQPELLTGDREWELVKVLMDYDDAVAAAAAKMDSSLLTTYLYSLSKAFSRFYHDCPILNAGSPALARARLALCEKVLVVLQDALYLTNIPFLEVM